MKTIIEDIDRAAGDILRAQGLAAVYSPADDVSNEDDAVNFVDAAGRKSAVSLQLDSYGPSIDNASVTVFNFKTVELPVDGWKIVSFESADQYPQAKGRESLFSQLRKALEDNDGAFDLTEGSHPGVLSHPMSEEAFVAIGDYAASTGVDFKIQPYSKSGREGFELVAPDGRTARVDVMPGEYQITAAGERSTVPFRESGRTEMLKGVLDNGFAPSGMRY